MNKAPKTIQDVVAALDIRLKGLEKQRAREDRIDAAVVASGINPPFAESILAWREDCETSFLELDIEISQILGPVRQAFRDQS